MIYLSVLADKLQCHSCKKHSNRQALALIVIHNLYTYKSTGKHQLAWFLLFACRKPGR